MDALTRLGPAAAGLLATVDGALSVQGAPADHPIWPLIRRCAVLPGEAVEMMESWSAQPWLDRAAVLRAQATAETAAADELAIGPRWAGRAASAYQQNVAEVGAELDVAAAGRDDLAARLEEMAGWLAETRLGVAGAVAAVLRSQAAVTLRCAADVRGEADVTVRAQAAADIGVAVLSAIDGGLTSGETVLDSWAIASVDVHARAAVGDRGGDVLRLDW